MFQLKWVAENTPIKKARCSLCHKTTTSIACMNNMHLGLVGGVQNYKCEPCKQTDREICIAEPSWEAAWLRSELGKAPVVKEEDISAQTAGSILEQEWGRIKQVDNVGAVFQTETTSTGETPNTPPTPPLIPSEVAEKALEEAPQQLKELKEEMQKEEATFLQNLQKPGSIFQAHYNAKVPENTTGLQAMKIEDTKDVTPSGSMYDIEVENASSMRLQLLAKEASKRVQDINTKTNNPRRCMSNIELRHEINDAIRLRGRETRIAGFYDPTKEKKPFETPKRKKAPKKPTSEPSRTLARPRLSRQHTIRRGAFLGKNTPRTQLTQVIWLWGLDIDYVTYEAGKYYTPPAFDGGLQTFKWGPGARIGDKKHDGTGRKWWDGYDQHDCVLIERLEEDWIPISMMIDLMGQQQMLLDRRGLPAGKNFNSRLLIITSQTEPNELYKTQGSAAQRWTFAQRLRETGNKCEYIYNPLY